MIDDGDEVEKITFATVKHPTTIVEWETLKVVPIQITLKKDLVDIIIHK